VVRIKRPECPYPQALKDGDYSHRKNKVALRDASFDKCMYCESRISHIDYANVEHIKPKAPGKYPELAYVWENLGYACSRCNTNKSEKYSEATPYIDPYSEDPEEHIFASGALLFTKNGSERGELTISDIDLNRPDLLEKRQGRIEEIAKAITACFRTQNNTLRNNALKAIQEEALPDKEYSLVVKTLIYVALQNQ
jgi:uncharacterized protein (TIGR02646 family)